MNTYLIKKIKDDSELNTVPMLELENRYYDTPKDVRVFAGIGYSDDALHVHLRTVESEHRAEEVGALGEPYHDSCLEFFFSPVPGDPKYFNFEFNSNKCLYVGYGENLQNSARLIVDVEERFSPKVSFNTDGWEIEYHIPFAFIRLFAPNFQATPGVSIRANCYKCADMMQPEQYLSWSLITPEKFTFHRPECFGLMIFGE